VPSPAAFYFDLSSPLAYLAAERILHVLGGPAEWQPVLAAELPGAEVLMDEAERDRIAGRAAELGLQPLRWPDPFPFNSTLAMRVATYAKSIGRTVPFAQAAFRQAFAGGRCLVEEDSVLIAAAACEMHPKAVLKGAGMRSVAEQLQRTTVEAGELGVQAVPAIAIGGHVFHGESAPEQAAAHLLEESIG
jgi:2-hydroxychromene-2-carboxylate isomerase